MTIHDFIMIILQAVTTLSLFAIANVLYNKYRLSAQIKAWNKYLTENPIKNVVVTSNDSTSNSKLH